MPSKSQTQPVTYTAEEQAYLDSLHCADDDPIWMEMLAEMQDKIDSRNKRVSFNPYRWCEHENVDEAVSDLCARYQADKSYDVKRLHDVTKIVLMNLYFTLLVCGDDYWVAYSRGKNVVDIPKRYRRTGMSHKYLCFVTDWLHENDYTAQEPGYYDREHDDHRNSIVTRMKATETLVNDVFKRFSITANDIIRHPNQELVELRKSKNAFDIKSSMDYEDCLYVRPYDRL